METCGTGIGKKGIGAGADKPKESEKPNKLGQKSKKPSRNCGNRNGTKVIVADKPQISAGLSKSEKKSKRRYHSFLRNFRSLGDREVQE